FPRIPDELDRIPEPVNATDQNAAALEILAVPDPRRPVPLNLVSRSPRAFEIARQHVAVPDIAGGFTEFAFLEAAQRLGDPTRSQMLPGEVDHSRPLDRRKSRAIS